MEITSLSEDEIHEISVALARFKGFIQLLDHSEATQDLSRLKQHSESLKKSLEFINRLFKPHLK